MCKSHICILWSLVIDLHELNVDIVRVHGKGCDELPIMGFKRPIELKNQVYTNHQKRPTYINELSVSSFALPLP